MKQISLSYVYIYTIKYSIGYNECYCNILLIRINSYFHIYIYRFWKLVEKTSGCLVKADVSVVRRIYEMNKTELNIVLSGEQARTSSSVIHSHIPVPRISNAIKAQERCPPSRRGSFEKLSRGVSVAAQRASFEKLDASVQQQRWRNNNLSSSSIEMRNSAEKLSSQAGVNSKTNETVGAVKLSRSNSLESKWRNKYEESEKRRKLLLQKSEAGN